MRLGFHQLIVLALVLLGGIGALFFDPRSIHAETVQQAPTCTNSFAGVVYFDQNRDGSYNGNERYLPGEIEIVDDQGATQQIIQSGDGVFSASQLACNTYVIHHNQVRVGTVVIGEVMTQEVKMFPKAQTFFFPLIAYQAR